MQNRYTFIKGKLPIVAAAIHEGHDTRMELADFFNLSDEERLREEDPFTAKWLTVSDNRIIVHHSRFETDVNRPRDKAVYVKPADAWGLQVWKNELSADVINASLALYDDFYARVKEYFDSLFTQHEKLIVYDIHSYNYRRQSRHMNADPEGNPEINIGTKNMEQKVWQPLIQVLMDAFRQFDYNGRYLDVRENIKFKGGYFGQWLFEQYGKKVCPVSIEFKKFFMDEWTGEPFDEDIALIGRLIHKSKEPVLKSLSKINI